MEGGPSREELARAEQAAWAAVAAAGLDASDDSHLWQTVFFAAQRAALERAEACDAHPLRLRGRPSG